MSTRTMTPRSAGNHSQVGPQGGPQGSPQNGQQSGPQSGSQNGKHSRGILFEALSRVPARNTQCYLLLLVRVFQQSMRNVLSPLLLYMAADLGIDITQKGTLLSAVAAGYLFTQVPGGALADKVGAKNVITWAVAASAICCLLVPTCATYFGVRGLWWIIALMGAVQGPLFPTSTVFLSRWMPKKTAESRDEKAWGTSMLDIGISVGSLISVPLANRLADAVGWRNAYHIIGLLSLSFVPIWQFLGAESPSSCWFIQHKELEFLQRALPAVQTKKSIPKQGTKEKTPLLGMPSALMLHPALWAIFVAHITFNYGAYMMTNWNPTYYSEVLKMSPTEMSFHLCMPHVLNLAAKALNPVLNVKADKLGFRDLSSRRLFTAIGFMGSALMIIPIYQLRNLNPWITTLFFSFGNAFFGLAPNGFKSNYLDVTQTYVGTVSGIGNTLGTVASWAGPQFVAFILSHFASWNMVFLSVALMNLIASVNFAFNATITPVERSLEAEEKKES